MPKRTMMTDPLEDKIVRTQEMLSITKWGCVAAIMLAVISMVLVFTKNCPP